LFLVVDVNCDGNLSWHEFMSFLVPASGAKLLQVTAGDQGDFKSPRKLLAAAQSQQEPHFTSSATHEDTIQHHAPIIHASLLKQYDKLILLE
jgi:hypothetical protein